MVSRPVASLAGASLGLVVPKVSSGDSSWFSELVPPPSWLSTFSAVELRVTVAKGALIGDTAAEPHVRTVAAVKDLLDKLKHTDWRVGEQLLGEGKLVVC